MSAFGTTTFGFILWTLLFTAVCWFAGVTASWIKLRRIETYQAFRQALRHSFLLGVLLAAGALLILICSSTFFFVRTVYRDHQSLVDRIADLSKEKSSLQEALEYRQHSMVTTDPAFGNTIFLLQAFNVYRHVLNGKPCVLLLSPPAGNSQGGAMASMVAQFSNSVSGCFTFGPMDSNADPDVEKRANAGMIPDKIVFHAERGNRAADQLFNNLSSLMQMRRSYDIPTPVERSHLYSTPNPGRS